MARNANTPLTGVFDKYKGKTEQNDETAAGSELEAPPEQPSLVTNAKKKEPTDKIKPEIDPENEVDPSGKTIRDVTNSLLEMYDQKSKKKTVEETHTRSTFLFRNDLQTRLDKLAKGKRGFKTMFLNKAIEALLDEMEDAQKYK